MARLLTLVPYLHARGEVPLGEASAALGVEPAQLLADLKVLFMCGLPGGFPDDLIDVDLDALEGPDGLEPQGVIRVANADYLARPMRLTPTEATALIVALRALRSGSRAQTREIVDRALGKLEVAAAQGLPTGTASNRTAARFDPGDDAADADLALLATRLQGAADSGRQVRISYYVPSRDQQSDRVVDPRGVVSGPVREAVAGHLYLDAWCRSAEAPRLFRLDRIDRAEVLESPVQTPRTGPRDLGEGIFSQSDQLTCVTLLLAPEARWVAHYYPVEDVADLGDGTTRVRLLVADPAWLNRLLLRLTPYAAVDSPQMYAESFQAAAQQTLSLYT